MKDAVSVVKFSATVMVVADVAISASTTLRPLLAATVPPVTQIKVSISNLSAWAAVRAVRPV